MNYTLRLLFSALFLTVGNICYPQENLIERIKKDYIEMISVYPASLIDHFPQYDEKILARLKFSYPGASNINDAYTIFLYSADEIKKNDNKVKLEAIASYHFKDSCLMIVDYEPSSYDPVQFKLCQYNCFTGKYPVPNFEFLANLSLPLDFYKDAVIYVLGAENGKYLKDEYLWNEGVGLPSPWENGYSKGVVISDNIAIYWLNIW